MLECWQLPKELFIITIITNNFVIRHFYLFPFTQLDMLFSVTSEKAESEEEESIENESELGEKLEDCDQRKTIRVKPFGGPLLAQA